MIFVFNAGCAYFVNPGVIFMTFSVDNLPFFSVGDDDQDKFPSFDQNVTSTSAGPSKSEDCSSSVVQGFQLVQWQWQWQFYLYSTIYYNQS